MSLQRRVSVITDCQVHLGPDLALEMASRDHDLVLGQADGELVEQVRALGSHVVAVDGVADLTRPESVQTLVDAALDTFGRLDSACIRTGRIVVGDFMSATEADVVELAALNITSVLFALQALTPVMIDQGGGQIVIVTSASGESPSPGAALYSATRAAANMLVRNAAATVAASHVTINAIGTNYLDYPGFREATGADDPKIRAYLEQQVPLKRFGQPAEVAHFAAGLLDGKNRFQTGQFFALSGGA
jgi:3-oxoacyl-[acyl-carrier protein] reductase